MEDLGLTSDLLCPPPWGEGNGGGYSPEAPLSSPVSQLTLEVATATGDGFSAPAAESRSENDASDVANNPAPRSPLLKGAPPSPLANGTARTTDIATTPECPIAVAAATATLPAFPLPGEDETHPATLTYQGVGVTLENHGVWRQFSGCGTEMILTKPGRRMFPYCRYRLSGLEPHRRYSLVLSIVPADQLRYRWNAQRWEPSGPAEQISGLLRAFPHDLSPALGSDWMGDSVSFYKLKLTNNVHDRTGHIILQSMHRYVPRLHVIPVPDQGGGPTAERPVVQGPQSMTFTFPQTTFMAVTTYQNPRITHLKIQYNPFAKGFRDDGNFLRIGMARLEGAVEGAEREGGGATGRPTSPPAADEPLLNGSTEVVAMEATLDVKEAVPSPVAEATQTGLPGPPTTSPPVDAEQDEEEEIGAVLPPPPFSSPRKMVKAARPRPPPSPAATPPPSPAVVKRKVGRPRKYPKRPPPASSPDPSPDPSHSPSPAFTRRRGRRRTNRRWGNSRGRGETEGPPAAFSPGVAVAMQPELDDVEGLLFVSFTSKEALGIHVRDKPVICSSPASPVPPAPRSQPEQSAGLKAGSIDPTTAVSLSYPGDQHPLPSPAHPEQGSATARSPGAEGLPFVSRTGKTSDLTKIKGWRDKFIKGKESSPKHEAVPGLPKDLSAFCSDMLDQYLESEAARVSERAAAFAAARPPAPAAYRLPARSCSYVKTLDSVLRERRAPPPRPGPGRPSRREAPDASLVSHKDPPAEVSCGLGSASPSGPCDGPRLCKATRRIRGQGSLYRPVGLSKQQQRLVEMENDACNLGLSRTWLTPERLRVALSAMVTVTMPASQRISITQYRDAAAPPPCGRAFCRLGCVCGSLTRVGRGPLHCRRPACMLGCSCFKRKITKTTPAATAVASGTNAAVLEVEEDEAENRSNDDEPVYAVTTMDCEAQPGPGYHSDKLWDGGEDPEPLFALVPPRVSPKPVLKTRYQQQTSQQMLEEMQSPVYKYFESLMTCARVREFCPLSKDEQPSVTTPAAFLRSTVRHQMKASNKKAANIKTTNDNQNTSPAVALATPATAAAGVGEAASTPDGSHAERVEIQSDCSWKEDRGRLLAAICRNVKQKDLCPLLRVGPYLVRLLSRIVARTPKGSSVTYKVHISKPEETADGKEEEEEEEEEEAEEEEEGEEALPGNGGGGSCGELAVAENEYMEVGSKVGVMPFMRGVIPAGTLTARRKPSGGSSDPAVGLVQVNGKSYNQARLLLGNMGSLHPANRLAAYITGRLNLASRSPQHTPQGAAAALLVGPERTSPAAAAAPPVEGRTTSIPQGGKRPLPAILKRSKQPPLSPATGSSSSAATPVRGSSPYSKFVAVSSALASPGFLGQSGTYSFRICPPTSSATGGASEKRPATPATGVALPGGFTLIQLPAHAATGPPDSCRGASGTNAAPGRERGGVAARLTCDETMPSDESENTRWCGGGGAAGEGGGEGAAGEGGGEGAAGEAAGESQAEGAAGGAAGGGEGGEGTALTKEESDEESDVDVCSGDTTSESSDYGDDDNDVDIETVDVTNSPLEAFGTRAVPRVSSRARDTREDSESDEQCRKRQVQVEVKERRKNHTELERLRRSEQRVLFRRLQELVLQNEPSAPKLRLLSLGISQIRDLVETSQRLEAKKKKLRQIQAVLIKEISNLSGKPELLIEMKLKEIYEKKKLLAAQRRAAAVSSQSSGRSSGRPTLALPRSSPLWAAAMVPGKSQPPLAAPSPALGHPRGATHRPCSPAGLPRAQQPQLTAALALLMARHPRPTTVPSDRPQQGPHPGPKARRLLQPGSKPEAVASPTPAPVPTVQPGAPPSRPRPPLPHPLSSAVPSQAATAAPCWTPEEQPDVAAGPRGKCTKKEEEEEPVAPSGAVASSPSRPAEGSRPLSLTPRSESAPPPPLNLPLIRSRTGRIILPSCLKPLGQGYYTLMVVGPNGEKPSEDPESTLEQLKALCPPKQEEEQQEEERHASSSASDATHASPAGRPSAQLHFTHVSEAEVKPVKAPPMPLPPLTRRGRGRPRKHPLVAAAVEDTPKAKSPPPTAAAAIAVPTKRMRGRPRKASRRGSSGDEVEEWSPPKVMRLEDSPAGATRSAKTPVPPRPIAARPPASPPPPEVRPLTRAALGKDFPSAKKRSWNDVEKELGME